MSNSYNNGKKQENKRRILFGVLVIAVLCAAFSAAYVITTALQRKKPGPDGRQMNADVTSVQEFTLPGEPAAQDPGNIQPDENGGVTHPAAASETTTVPEAEPAEIPSGASGPSEPTYIGGILIANKTYALPSDYNPGGLTSECEDAFYEMRDAAAAGGLDIYIASGFRSYDTQASIYQRYCDEDGQAQADTYSARPGHSEHQTGLAIDLNSISSDFAYTAEGEWVAEHCHEYGFILRYPADKVDITGYMYEPWHIRYVGRDNAEKIHASGLCLEEYLGIDSEYTY